ncbi:tyrosine-type recombinase/integrase [Pacificoceanicola onchidii]|uniref:tyrosine-type recombinase/integrase n=1 Tax=Pacificoceanicola onchidii TaxID=2562685 RepID=UPI0010A39DA9|nr:tyrosine-type recombinase/integrase [Pacificoceanicola onchidii]
MSISLPYVTKDRDRNGNERLYYRRHGKKFRLRGPVGSPEFLVDYQLAMAGHVPKEQGQAKLSTTKNGSMRELIEHYYRCAAFTTLAPRTRHVRRQILDRFCCNINDGDKPFASLQTRHLLHRRDVMADRPEAANGMIKALRQVFKFAVEYGYCDDNPAMRVPMLTGSEDGFPPWTFDDVAKFEKRHPIGSMARLALSLALCTGQRRSDLVLLGPGLEKTYHGREGLEFVQFKNRNNKQKRVSLWVPIVPELRAIIDVTPTNGPTYIVGARGRPMTAESFGNRFRDWCDEAGLKGLSAHGLRKTASVVLAENGCTEQEIMAITGHRTSKEVIRYTRSAEQKTRAVNAVEKINPRPAQANKNPEKNDRETDL